MLWIFLHVFVHIFVVRYTPGNGWVKDVLSFADIAKFTLPPTYVQELEC